jgi:hypothetical protein
VRVLTFDIGRRGGFSMGRKQYTIDQMTMLGFMRSSAVATGAGFSLRMRPL